MPTYNVFMFKIYLIHFVCTFWSKIWIDNKSFIFLVNDEWESPHKIYKTLKFSE